MSNFPQPLGHFNWQIITQLSGLNQWKFALNDVNLQQGSSARGNLCPIRFSQADIGALRGFLERGIGMVMVGHLTQDP